MSWRDRTDWPCPVEGHKHSDPRDARDCWKSNLSHKQYWRETRYGQSDVAQADAAAAILDKEEAR